MKSGFSTSPRGLAIFILAIWTMLAGTGCTGLFGGKLFKERAAETPAPADESVDKSFFVDPTGKPKTFMCGWAPESATGFFGEAIITPLTNNSPHCNVEFEITQDYLVGRMVQPSFLNDRARWQTILRIPIRKHFYYERDKDAHGRETNRWIENDARSHWSARPKMKLDLAAVQLFETGEISFGGWRTSNVRDIEWDTAKGFLGFSADMTGIAPFRGYRTESEYQMRLRVNFMEFQHDPTFKKIPYHQENARLMNVLHVLGRKIEGVEPELYAGHWDLRQSRELHLNGVPKHLEKTVVTAVYRWNKQLQQSGVVPQGHNAFIPVISNLKHPFDLRYPSITWISDRRISASAPLGIGMASADVRNGKILWGSVLIFGGEIEEFINAYTPVGGAGAAAKTSGKEQPLSPAQALAGLLPSFRPIEAVERAHPGQREQLVRNLRVDHANFLKSEIKRAAQVKGAEEQLAQLTASLENFQSNDPHLNAIVADLLSASHDEMVKGSGFFRDRGILELIGAADAKAAVKNEGARPLRALAPAEREKMLAELRPQSSPFVIESELTVENLAGSWLASPARKTRTYPEMLESVVMQLTMHEIGHFLGLGHQFKENILPEPGTVPTRLSRQLEAKASEAAGFTNQTSVMGYPSGRVETLIAAADVWPGPQDDLVLRYIYGGQYASYDKGADEFVFTQVPASGRIPERSTVKTKSGEANLPTSYFPACNDYEASLGADPYCNRWDRGNTAEAIVKSYFEFVSDNLLANLYSLVGGGSDPDRREYRLWHLALSTFSRVRLFYDEMRRRLRSEPHLKPLWNQLRRDKDALFEFSSACQKQDPTSEKEVNSRILREIFEDRSIADLCRANAVALKEFSFFLNLPDSDYTKIDHRNRYVSGGYLMGDAATNYGHIFGSWYQMTNLPLKFSALFTLATASPYIIWGGYTVPNPYYDNEENRFLYRTLYPREYTRMISDTVQHNMRFATSGLDDTTTMGRAIVVTGGLLPWQRYMSNDSARLPDEFNNMLSQQTRFDYSIAAVLIEAMAPDPQAKVKPDHYKKFTGKIYDFISGRSVVAGDVFILPKGQVLVRANGMFLYPITKLKFYEGTNAYVIAYKVSYDYEAGDLLIEDSVKYALMEKHGEIVSACVNGFNGNGLLSHFGSAEETFDGFKIPPGIANENGKEKISLFQKSVDEAFDRYEKTANQKIPPHFPIKRMRAVCEEAVRGVGQISAAASLINGYWLGITADYLEK